MLLSSQGTHLEHYLPMAPYQISPSIGQTFGKYTDKFIRESFKLISSV